MADKLASLEITVFSAEDLTQSGHPVKKNAFVIVRTDPHTHASTMPDTEGGSFPCWNQKLHLSLPRSVRFISVEVRRKAGTDERILGEVNIPVSDFYGGMLPSDYLHMLSYRLRDRRGQRNGIINLSIRAHCVQIPVNAPPQVPPAFPWVPCRQAETARISIGNPTPACRYPM